MIKERVEITECMQIQKLDLRIHSKWPIEYNTQGIKPDNVKYCTVIN